MDYKVHKDGILINVVTADEQFVEKYCEANGYTYEEIEREPVPEAEQKPTQLDIIEAQVTYTAMMTDTLLEA